MELILAATGQDVSLPPLDAEGKVELNEESLNKMKKEQSQELHRLTPKCSGTSKRNKKSLIKDILKHHPLVEVGSMEEEEEEESLSTDQPFGHLLKETCDTTPIYDFYSDNFGMVDQLNKLYYAHLNPAGHQTWRKLYLMSILFLTLMSAFGLYKELLFQKAQSQRNARARAVEEASSYTLTTFIINVCTQICAHF